MKRLFITIALISCLPALHAQQPAKDHNFEVSKNLETFNSIYNELDLFYVDTLDAEKVVRVGIDAMLSELDPYTEYYPKEEVSDLKMMTTGKYGGIGSIIRMRKDSSVIISEPYEGMPAAIAGLQAGDVLRKIDDVDLKGKSVSEVSDLLRGEPATTFRLEVMRPGEKSPRTFNITRKNIQMPVIEYETILDGNKGYIYLTSFTENCSAEVRKSVISLKEKGAESIIFDLRGNGGGLLQEAIKIVNLFVPKGKEIVSTRGKVRSSNEIYKTTSMPLDENIPMVVLVNSNTASAAEIVSGSLQDLDRAVIIGTRTLGKGLVQVARELPYDGSLKLTASKYYIPSGRCIQAIDYKTRREKLTVDGHIPDSLTHVFHTEAGREVRDGGGIMPDIKVAHDTLSNIVFYLANDDVLTDYGTEYCRNHTKPSSVAEFEITDNDFEDFKRMAIERDFKYDRLSQKRLDDLKKTAQFEGYYDDAKAEFEALESKLEHNLSKEFDHFKTEIKDLMGQEIVKRWFYQKGSVANQLKKDPDVAEAVKVLNDANTYNKILGK